MWCLIPSICSPEQEAESLQTYCSDIDLLAQSKSKVIPEKFCLHGSLTESYLDSLFGMTLPLSELTTQTPGTISSGLKKEDRNSPFVAGSRSCARTSARQVAASESTARKVDCGQKWLELWAKYDHLSSSWKTAQCSLFEDLERSLVIWPTWGMAHDGACFQHAPLVRHTHGKDCFYWHTPTANDCKPAGQAEMREVEKWLKGAAIKNTYIRLRSLLAARCGRREPPNPPFLEWLMGWPIGWTEVAPLAMDKYQLWQQQHSNCSQKEPELSEA